MSRRNNVLRLQVASAALLILFLVLALAAYLGGRKVESASVFISDDAVPGSVDAYALRTVFSDNIRHVSAAAFAATREAKLQNLALAHDCDAAFAKAVAAYEATIHINPTRDHVLLKKLTDQYAEFNRTRDEFEARVRAGDTAGANALFDAMLAQTFGAATSAADDLVDYNHANVTSFSKAIIASMGALRRTVLVVVVLALVCGFILVCNLVARHKQQRQLKESERRLRLALDNLFAFVGVCQPDGILVEINRAALDAAGVKREEVIGKPFHETCWWSHSANEQDRLAEVMAEAAAGKTVRYDTSNRVAGDKVIAVDFGCGPIHDAQGRVMLLVVSGIDISERKRLEEQFIRAQRMEAIGNLSGGLAHDLNNILAPILMAAGLLKMKLTTPGDQRIIEMINGGAQRGAGIIRQLLTLGRVSGGTKAELKLSHLLKEIQGIVAETFPRNIAMECNSPTNLWPVMGDITQLHQVLLNLAVNARDAMPDGGKLSLSFENARLDEAGAKIHRDAKIGPYVVATMTDTGEGIPQEIITRIFDPFFTTKPEGKGTGLGLSSVLGILKSHDGFLTVVSEPGKGTTFRFYLPAIEQAQAVAVVEPVDHWPRGQGQLVLVVDDEEAMREATRELLELHHYRVITAVNGAEAVRLFVEHRDEVELVLTDMDMPVMGGVELVHALRVLEGAVKFVLMSGSHSEEMMESFKALGAVDILSKPCAPGHLLKTLNRALSRSLAA